MKQQLKQCMGKSEKNFTDIPKYTLSAKKNSVYETVTGFKLQF